MTFWDYQKQLSPFSTGPFNYYIVQVRGLQLLRKGIKTEMAEREQNEKWKVNEKGEGRKLIVPCRGFLYMSSVKGKVNSSWGVELCVRSVSLPDPDSIGKIPVHRDKMIIVNSRSLAHDDSNQSHDNSSRVTWLQPPITWQQLGSHMIIVMNNTEKLASIRLIKVDNFLLIWSPKKFLNFLVIWCLKRSQGPSICSTTYYTFSYPDSAHSNICVLLKGPWSSASSLFSHLYSHITSSRRGVEPVAMEVVGWSSSANISTGSAKSKEKERREGRGGGRGRRRRSGGRGRSSVM